MSNHIVEWCRRKQDRFNKEGKPYAAKLMGLMAGYLKRIAMNDPKTFYYTLIDGVDLHDEIKIGDFLYEIVEINHIDGMMTVERITDEYLKGE